MRDSNRKSGPGYYHFPIGIDEEYFQQLTAEKQVTKYVKGYPKLEWVKVGPRNEALDCEVYCYAAAIRAGMARMDWDALDRTLKSGGPDDAPQSPQSKRKTGPPPGHWLHRDGARRFE